MPRPDQSLEEAVRVRAHHSCEYCLLPQWVRRLRFHIEHVIPRQHGGETCIENLALACGRCNRHKGPNLAGIDPLTRQMCRLFNPRTDRWLDHFRWAGAHIVGRVTVDVLSMNHPDEVVVREELSEIDPDILKPHP